MDHKNVENLSDKIARVIREDSGQADFSSVHFAIEKIGERLDRIESDLRKSNSPERPNRNHPSKDKFNVVEAITDEPIENFENEKACAFEPNGKPCDHCSMCNSRGF